MKRKTLLFSLILAMVIISLALCGADAPDGNISMDEDDFVELVVDAPLSLNYLESVYSLKAVNQIVGNEGEDGFAEVLFNANDEAEYVLATAEEGGYAIFHRMTGALMEAGEFGASPYAGQSGKKYYFGPSNYAVKDVNGVTTDIMRGGVMTTEQITAMHQYMAEKRALVVDRSETKSYANMLSALQSANTARQQGDDLLYDRVDDWGTNPYQSQITGASFTQVENSSFFRTMKNALQFGYNSHGSCVYVSTVLLMRYHDAFTSNALIPNKKENIPDLWEVACDVATDKPDLYNSRAVYFDCSIEEDDSVYEALHKFLIAISAVPDFTNSVYNITRYASILNENCISANSEERHYSTDVENNIFNDVKSQIDESNPVAISIGYNRWDETEQKVISIGHAITVYGYYQNESQRFYKAHFGWSNRMRAGEIQSLNAIIVPSYMATRDVHWIEVEDLHQSEENHACQNTVVNLGTTINCFDSEGHIYIADIDGLEHSCICGMNNQHAGAGIIDSWQDYGIYNASEHRSSIYSDNANDKQHFYTCQHCLNYYLPYYEFSNMSNDWYTQYYRIYEYFFRYATWETIKVPHSRGQVFASEGKCMAECEHCGYIYEIPHVGNFTYIGRKNYHITTCTNCGGTFQENHAYAIGINGCVHCGYGADLGGGIIHNA